MRRTLLVLIFAWGSSLACDAEPGQSAGSGVAEPDDVNVEQDVAGPVVTPQDALEDVGWGSVPDVAADAGPVSSEDVSLDAAAPISDVDMDAGSEGDVDTVQTAWLPEPLPVSLLPVPAPIWLHQERQSNVVLDEDGESEDLFFDLPEETTSVFVMVKGEESAYLTLKKAVTPPPLSESIVKGPGEHICIPCANRVVSAQHIGSVLVPNDPDVEVKGGTWTFKVRATHRVEDLTAGGLVFYGYPSTCDVTVLARKAPVPETGVLRIRLHFTGSHELSAETAPDSERLQQALDLLTAIFATAGVGIEIAGYHDVVGVAEDPTLTDVGSTEGYPNDLSKLFLAGHADEPGALNVFFVNSIYKDLDYEQVGGVVLGIAGGVPGPAYMGPSYRSGVAIATFEISEDDHLGNVMAHEIGHYLGLFHSTEKNAIFHDTIEDTAEDDGENLMFWGWSVDGLVLSESQSFVMRSHPMVIPDE